MSKSIIATSIALSLNIRTAADVNADIDALNKIAEDSGTSVSGAQLNVLELEKKAAAAVEKFEKATAALESQEAVAALAVGDTVTLVFGRAAGKVILSGAIVGVEDSKTGRQFGVLTGSGMTSRVVNVGSDAILLTEEAVAAVQAEIDAAVAEAAAAKAKADAAA